MRVISRITVSVWLALEAFGKRTGTGATGLLKYKTPYVVPLSTSELSHSGPLPQVSSHCMR
jgi:hypothetical protein